MQDEISHLDQLTTTKSLGLFNLKTQKIFERSLYKKLIRNFVKLPKLIFDCEIKNIDLNSEKTTPFRLYRAHETRHVNYRKCTYGFIGNGRQSRPGCKFSTITPTARKYHLRDSFKDALIIARILSKIFCDYPRKRYLERK